jgi:hypothetical protein
LLTAAGPWFAGLAAVIVSRFEVTETGNLGFREGVSDVEVATPSRKCLIAFGTFDLPSRGRFNRGEANT